MNRTHKEPGVEIMGAAGRRTASYAGVAAILLAWGGGVDAAVIDFTNIGAGFSESLGDGIFAQGSATAGSGTFKSAIKLKGNAGGTVEGYNTSGTFQYDEKKAVLLQLSDLTTTVFQGEEWVAFGLDINEASDKYLSLDKLELYVDSVVHDSPDHPNNMGTKVYDMDDAGSGDSTVLLEYTGGSGGSEMWFFLDPETLRQPGFRNSDYVYLYSQLGASEGTSYTTYDGNLSTWDNESGDDEWAVVEADGTTYKPFDVNVPEPGTSLLFLGGLGLLGARVRCRRRTAASSDD